MVQGRRGRDRMDLQLHVQSVPITTRVVSSLHNTPALVKLL
jgi:hypothetical protein